MLTTLLYCLTMAWTPATGPVATYSLYIDGTLSQSNIAETQVSVCFEDELPHIVTVKAFDAEGNSGLMSDGGDQIQMVLDAPTSPVPVPVCNAADLDRNGIVGMSDFGLFGQCFGEQHN